MPKHAAKVQHRIDNMLHISGLVLFLAKLRQGLQFCCFQVVYLCWKSTDMEQIYIDSLNALMVYKYDLDAVVLELERVEHHNSVLYFILVVLSLAAVAAGVVIIRGNKKRLAKEKLANKLLSRQAEGLPLLADKVNKISSKSIKLSGPLYDELQDAISAVRTSSKSGIVEVVNDADFLKLYPYIKGLDYLSAQEKLVLILTEEDYQVGEIALYIGATEATVRAIKSRIRSKLIQSGSIGGNYKKLKTLKKN